MVYITLMSIGIASAIFIGFLASNLAVGLWSSRGIRNIREYAIGNRNFSTATITATIVATWASGNSIGMASFDSHSMGVFFLIPGLADAASLLLVSVVFAPRVGEFLGSLSVADAMGNLYGREVRIISAISGIMPAIGNVAVQFVILAAVLSHALGISSFYALLISSCIIITYSTFGGIKAVTFTDMIQFFTFGVVIPMTAFLIWKSVSDVTAVMQVLTSNPIFDYTAVFDYSSPNFNNTLLLFFFFLLPGLDPAVFQRIAMAKNTIQVARSFGIASIVMLCLYIMFWLIGLLILADNNDLKHLDDFMQPTNLIGYILDTYMHSGLKGFFIIGIMAMIMSTADSYINCSAVLFSYDFCKSIKIKLTDKKELLLARLSALFIGIAGLLLSLFAKNLLDLVLSTYSFYMPIVTVPLILGIFGFRSTSKSILMGMGAGFVTVVLFKILNPETNNIIPGMIANIVFLFGTHYLFHQAGGWVGIKDKSPLEAIRLERKRKIENFVYIVKNFNFIKFCKNNTPKEESFYVYFGLLCIVSIFSSVYSLPRNVSDQYASLISFLHYSILIISTIFITYPGWSENFKNETFIAITWNTAMVYCLVFTNNLLFIISSFDQTLLTILIVNLITAAILLRWQVVSFVMLVGILCSVEFYKWFNNIQVLTEDMSAQFKIIYSLLLVSSILIAFLKPKQEYLEATETRAKDLESETKSLKRENAHAKREIESLSKGALQLHEQLEQKGAAVTKKEQELKTTAKELQQQLAKMQNMVNIDDVENLKEEFFRNLQHESNTPMTAIITKSDILYDAYDTLDSNVIKDTIKDIVIGSERLKTYVNNLVDISKLKAAAGNELDKVHKVNLSNLVKDRTNHFKKIFSDDKHKAEFKLDIEQNLIVECNEYYITQLLDNLIINADTYGKNSVIEIHLKKMNSIMVEFKITDHGIGIPQEELNDVFKSFTTSSKTRTPAGGRGLGLALCQKVIEVHQGKILAESDDTNGTTFLFVIPFNYHYKDPELK